jgi:hypothetical protein
MKQKGFAPIIILVLIIALVSIGYFIYKDLKPLNQSTNKITISSPTPTASQAPNGDLANWKTYTGSLYSFKYPQDYKINENKIVGVDGVFSPATDTVQIISSVLEGTNGDFMTITHEDTTYDLQMFVNIKTSVQTGVTNFWSNNKCDSHSFGNSTAYKIDAVSGLIFKRTSCDGEAFYYIFLVNKRVGYTIIIKSTTNSKIIETIYNQILSNFKFLGQNTSTQTGTVTGKLCYPSDFLPPGRIVAKDTTSGKTYTQDYIGSVAGGKTTYSFSLTPGIYHLRYEQGGTSNTAKFYGYYDECAKTMGAAECTPDSGHINIDVKVLTDKEIPNVDLCDFYSSPSQSLQLDSNF